jgi:hypothetical protein
MCAADAAEINHSRLFASAADATDGTNAARPRTKERTKEGNKQTNIDYTNYMVRSRALPTSSRFARRAKLSLASTRRASRLLGVFEPTNLLRRLYTLDLASKFPV